MLKSIRSFLSFILLVSLWSACGSRKQEQVVVVNETDVDEIPAPVIRVPNEQVPDQPIERLISNEGTSFRLAFYNLENLFDTIDGSNMDEEYLPNGRRNWNTEKYQNKLKHLAQVIDSIEPHVLGVCEVENRQVLEDLKAKSRWLSLSYSEIVHQESPDKRGIDVAMFYVPSWAYYGGQGVDAQGSTKQPKLNKEFEVIPVSTGNPEKPTRDILAVHLRQWDKKFTVFVNHWPSRSGGEAKSRHLRAKAAKALRDYIDAHQEIQHWAAVGDFNDNPSDSSLRYVLGAGDNTQWAVNLAYEYRQLNPSLGTGKYRGNWDMFDQIILSRSLYHIGPEAPIPSLTVYNKPWLLQQDGKYKGYPLRTFGGKTYLNGYSDHLPVYAEIYLNK